MTITFDNLSAEELQKLCICRDHLGHHALKIDSAEYNMMESDLDALEDFIIELSVFNIPKVDPSDDHLSVCDLEYINFRLKCVVAETVVEGRKGVESYGYANGDDIVLSMSVSQESGLEGLTSMVEAARKYHDIIRSDAYKLESARLADEVSTLLGKKASFFLL